MDKERALVAKLDKFYETNTVMTRTEFNQLLLSLKRERATAFTQGVKANGNRVEDCRALQAGGLLQTKEGN